MLIYIIVGVIMAKVGVGGGLWFLWFLGFLFHLWD